MPDPAYRDREWKRLRSDWVVRLSRGAVVLCRKCGERVMVGQPWDLGHGVPWIDGGGIEDAAPEHRSCNRRDGQAISTRRKREAREARRAANPGLRDDRIVVLLCGPPGAGKTTAASKSDLDVYDFDDPRWEHSNRRFNRALHELSSDDTAHAVVIRWCPRSTDRARVARQVSATHVWVMTGNRRELATRIVRRNRADRDRTLAALDGWFRQFDRLDGVEEFPGWSALDPPRRLAL